jgi:DNA-binding LacI/PurR family transcriptional regulator
LASRKTRVIGLLLNNLHNDFFVPLLNGVEAVVRKKGYNLIVATYHANSRDNSQPPIGPHNTDGLLIFSDGLAMEDLTNLHESGFRWCWYTVRPAVGSNPSVTVENIEITQKLIECIQARQKRILFWGPVHQEDSMRAKRVQSRSESQRNF